MREYVRVRDLGWRCRLLGLGGKRGRRHSSDISPVSDCGAKIKDMRVRQGSGPSLPQPRPTRFMNGRLHAWSMSTWRTLVFGERDALQSTRLYTKSTLEPPNQRPPLIFCALIMVIAWRGRSLACSRHGIPLAFTASLGVGRVRDFALQVLPWKKVYSHPGFGYCNERASCYHGCCIAIEELSTHGGRSKQQPAFPIDGLIDLCCAAATGARTKHVPRASLHTLPPLACKQPWLVAAP